jgi:methionyl-tRNA formyltransferase
MGTPNFAVPTLQKLINEPQIEIIGVYTKEPKIAGRGHKIQNSPIHNLALDHNLPIFYPKSLKSEEEKQKFINLKADFAVTVAYGLILPNEIIDGTKFGCLNIHPSILPKWRGAAPIERSMMAGDKKTAIAIIKMDENLDSGDIITMEKLEIDQKIHCRDFYEQLSNKGADIALKTLKNIASGNYQSIPQNHEEATYAKKIEKSEFLLDFHQDVNDIYNKIRALNGCGSAYFMMNNERIKIHEAEILTEKLGQKDFNISKSDFTINCQNGAIRPIILQKSGKNKVTLKEFLTQIN